jgi:hypothetical protein
MYSTDADTAGAVGSARRRRKQQFFQTGVSQQPGIILTSRFFNESVLDKFILQLDGFF